MVCFLDIQFLGKFLNIKTMGRFLNIQSMWTSFLILFSAFFWSFFNFFVSALFFHPSPKTTTMKNRSIFILFKLVDFASLFYWIIICLNLTFKLMLIFQLAGAVRHIFSFSVQILPLICKSTHFWFVEELALDFNSDLERFLVFCHCFKSFSISFS